LHKWMSKSRGTPDSRALLHDRGQGDRNVPHLLREEQIHSLNIVNVRDVDRLCRSLTGKGVVRLRFRLIWVYNSDRHILGVPRERG
jgi:hypothetical protein